MILQIEVDEDEWVGRSARDKISYLKRTITNKNRTKLINVGSKLVEGLLSIVRGSTTNRTVHRYLDLVDTGIGLSKVSMVINNMFISHRIESHNDNDELAQFMGRTKAADIFVNTIDSTPEICRNFLQMDAESQAAYGIKFTKIEYCAEDGTRQLTPPMAGKDPRTVTAFVLAKIDGHLAGFEVCYYMQAKGSQNDFDDQHSYSYINFGCMYTDIIDLTLVESIIYQSYVDSIDIRKNYIKIAGNKLRTVPRVEVDFDINNIDLNEMSRTIRTVLSSRMRRGYMIQGDPGTGKTVSIHKLMMQFPDTPVFWIASDAINKPEKIRSVFRMLNMFNNCIFVFDDIDGNDLGSKNELTTTFIECIDATSSERFSGVIILTINEPQRIHNTIKTRAERIDEVILVHNPRTEDEVVDVIFQRYRHIKAEPPEWMANRTPEFKLAVKTILDNQFTHAHIASIVSDLVKLNPDGYDCSRFEQLISRRVDSIANARMVADSNGHIAGT